MGAVVAAILLLGGDGGKIEPGAPSEASVGELRSLAGSVRHRVYWVGSFPGFKMEVTETSRGNVYVRYLPKEIPIGDPSPAYTTVATYPRRGAFQALAAKRKGLIRTRTSGGGVAVSRTDRPTSVYLAYPGSDLLVEVYAPRAGEARNLALSGRVRPVR